MKIEKFKLSEIEISQTLLITEGGATTAGGSTPIGTQSHYLMCERQRYITHDSDNVDDNGIVSFDNQQVSYGAWDNWWS